jgi:probable F420-dependent oxidoreductase
MRFGALINRRDDAASWEAGVRAADDLGYDVAVAGDHLGAGLSTLPALVTASQVAPRPRLGTYVMATDYRHPAVLALEAATVDQLTGGRLELGLGAGWLTGEYGAAGLPFDPAGVRTARMAEAVRVIKALMGPDPVTFEGDFFQIRDLDGQPKPLQQPHVPILVAGGGRHLLEFAAREADIIAINTRHRNGIVGTGAELLAETLARRVALVREAAGERWEGLELNLLLKQVHVTSDRPAVAAVVAPALGLTVEEALATPYLALGTVEQLADQLLATRERLGFSYFTVFQQDMAAFAPVIDRLRRP